MSLCEFEFEFVNYKGRVVILREWLLDYLVCPKTHKPLKLISVKQKEGDSILEGLLGSNDYMREFRIVRVVPRFVEDHYATGFGLQWNIHESTQIDNERTKHSAQRFWPEPAPESGERT